MVAPSRDSSVQAVFEHRRKNRLHIIDTHVIPTLQQRPAPRCRQQTLPSSRGETTALLPGCLQQIEHVPQQCIGTMLLPAALLELMQHP